MLRRERPVYGTHADPRCVLLFCRRSGNRPPGRPGLQPHLRLGLNNRTASHRLQLPLEPGSSQVPRPDPGSFLKLPVLSYASMEPAYAAARMRLASAGLSPQTMQDFLNFYAIDDSNYDLWLLADLTGVKHYSHIPVVLPVDPVSSDDEATPRPPLPPTKPAVMFATLLFRNAVMPKGRALFLGWGTGPPLTPGQPRVPGQWVAGMWGGCLTPAPPGTTCRRPLQKSSTWTSIPSIHRHRALSTSCECAPVGAGKWAVCHTVVGINAVDASQSTLTSLTSRTPRGTWP